MPFNYNIIQRSIHVILYLVAFYFTIQFIYETLYEKYLLNYFIKNFHVLHPVQENDEREISALLSGWIFSIISYFVYTFCYHKRGKVFLPLLMVIIIFLITRGYMTYKSVRLHDLGYAVKYIYSLLLVLFYVMYFIHICITVLLEKIVHLNRSTKI